MKTFKWFMISMVAGAAAAVLTAGCQHKDQRAAREVDSFFPADDAQRPVWRALEAQAVAGAADEAMLYPQHFDGNDLSALGRDRMDLILRADRRPVVVYLAVADDDAIDARHASVERFLQGAGVGGDAMQVRRGPNPEARSASYAGMARIGKTENPGGAANPGDTSNGGATGAAVNATAQSQGANGSR